MIMISISNREIINAVAGNIYSMHPYHLPEGIDKIMEHLVKVLDELPDSAGVVNDTFKLFKFQDFTEFRNWLKNILEQVPEYKQLNVSRALKDRGVKYGDPENEGFRFTSRYTRETLDDRYTNFIDLDALIGNICTQIDYQQQIGDDCFLCKYAKEYGSTKPSECDKCLNCLCHPNIRYNREPHPLSLKPFNQWTEEEKEKYSLF